MNSRMTSTWTVARACRQDAATWQDRTDERRAVESAGLELSSRMLRVCARRAVCREGESSSPSSFSARSAP